MKKNKLYTVNKWNQPAFMPERNLFPEGGSTNPFGVNLSAPIVSTPKIDWSNPVQRNMALGQTKALTSSFGSGNPVNLQQSNQMLSKTISKTGSSSGGGLFSKGGAGWGMAGATAGALGSINTGDPRGMWDTLDPVYHLADGRESAVGNAMSDAGVSLTQAGLSSGNPYLMVAGAGAKVIGGLTNAAFGMKTDQKKLTAANTGTSTLNNFVSNATSFDELQGPDSVAAVENAYKGGWFNKGKARRKNAALRDAREQAVLWADRSLDNNITNITQNQLGDALANYSAYGGYIGGDNDMGVIDYGFMQDYLTQKKREAEARNKMAGLSQMPAFMPQNSYAIGGDLQTHGGDFSDGLTVINAGLSHEENPNEGVQLGVDNEGTPNLVEEGEVIFNDYVFSNRIPCDLNTKKVFHIGKKREITYAELAKRLEKEISERPNDPISKSAFKKQMGMLEEQQERQKQEMEAARAREAFEALSPDEQTAVMQEVSARENLAAQEQAMAGQQAMQQPTPEEAAMMQQQQMMQADGSEAVLGQEPQMNAEGGKINRYDKGGKIKQGIFDALGIHTDSEFTKWLRENNAGDGIKNWEFVNTNGKFMDALAKVNPALADAINRGYDFGAYVPGRDGNITFDDDRGNWDAQTVHGWWDSNDPAWQEVIKNNPNLTKDTKLSKEELADLIRNTDAFKRGTQWLQDSEDNRLAYLQRIINNPNAPARARAYAMRYADANGWKQGAARDYATIFDNPSGRAANPGTYWKTPLEAVRSNMGGNYVINDDGTVEEITGEVPSEWSRVGNYAWASPEHDLSYNYYRRPSGRVYHAMDGDDYDGYIEGELGPEVGTEVRRETLPNGDTVIYHTRSGIMSDPSVTDAGNSDKGIGTGTGTGSGIKPKHRAEWLRYAGLFGPAVGLGMQALGIGRPDTSGIDAAASVASRPATLASYRPLGNYLTYRPMDIWFEQNRMDANSRATDRALMNTSGGNRGTAMAGLLANGYNSQMASGDLYRKALEYNDAQRERVAAFNRGTDQFNSEQFGQTSRFNADALNRQRQYNAQLQMQAAAQKAAADAGWYNSLYGNVSGLFKGLSNLGTENFRMNRIADMWADGLAGTVSEQTNTSRPYVESKKSKGGRMKRKGLTF